MNNSKIAIESVSFELEVIPDVKPSLRQRETEILQVLEAMENINSSGYWKLLRDKIFNEDFERLQRRIRLEKNPTEIYRLQGQIMLAEKYLNLLNNAQVYRNELQSIRSKLNEND